MNLGGLVILDQTIELATDVSEAFISNQGDGMLGLAFGGNNSVKRTKVATPVENMILQGDIPNCSELFTAWLSNRSEPSFFTFGYIDNKALGGQELSWTPIDKQDGFWLLDSSIAQIAGNFFERPNNIAMPDTGTTLCLVEDAFCTKMYSSIPGATYDKSQQGWVFPTTTDLSTLPKICLSIGWNQLFQIKPADLAFQDLENGFTYGGIQSRGNNPWDVLGCVFLRSVYAVFDQGRSRFGCVQRDLPTQLRLPLQAPLQPEFQQLPPTSFGDPPKRKAKRSKRLRVLDCCAGAGSGGDR